MLNWFRPRCPVNVCEKVWTEQRLNWLVAKFGRARLLQVEVVLPTRHYFPEAYDGTEAGARNLLDRVCAYMQVDPGTLDLEFYPQREHPDAGGRYERGERSVISVADTQLEDQERLIATLAHEVAHEILLGGGLLTGGEPDHEWLTDLTVVFLGMGVFAANTSVQQTNRLYLNWESWSIAKHGYLPARMTGYALALMAWARGETKPPWAAWLGADARIAIRDGVHYVLKTGDTLFELERPAELNGSPPLARIVSHLSSPSPSQRVAALWRLRERSEPPGPAVFDGVLKNLRDRDPLVRAEAAETLAFVSQPTPRACNELMEALRDENGQVRARAASALGRLLVPLEHRGPDESTLREELLVLMSDANPRVALAGAQALAGYGEACDEAGAASCRLLKRALADCDYSLLEELLACVVGLVSDSERFLREEVAGDDDDLWRLIHSGLQHVRQETSIAPDARWAQASGRARSS